MKQKAGLDFVARNIFIPFLKIWIGKVTGLENLPKNKPFILAPNHCSYIEHFLIAAILEPYLNRKICYIAKKEHFDDMMQKSWHRYWSRYVPQIPIDRNKGEAALKVAISHLKKGRVIVIYPEGTRSLTGKIQKGKTGIVRLALWSKFSIIPLGIKGTFDILPKGKRIPKLKKADFNFGKPISFNDYYTKRMNKKILRELTDNLMKEIARLSDQKYKH